MAYNKNKIQVPQSAATEDMAEDIDTGGGKKRKQKPASKAEKEQRAKEMKTQGRAGCRLPRINLATSPENYEFVRIMAKATGQNITKYVDKIITEYREKNGALYEEAKTFLEKAGKAEDLMQ